MKPSLQLKLGQHLTMTPQLQQAIRLLQLSTMDLQTEIQQTLEENPMLEMDEDTPVNEQEPQEKSEAELGQQDEQLDLDRSEEMPDELPVDPATVAPIAGNPSIVGNPYLFTGRRYDPENGWYYVKKKTGGAMRSKKKTPG